MKKLMNRTGLLAAAFALALAVALALNAATQTTEVAEAQTIEVAEVPPIGTDTDNDGLIEIKNYDQLYAMRYDEDGNGDPNYDLNNDGIRDDGIPPNAYSIHLSCPAASTCNGYELGGNISLAGHGDWVPSGLHTVFNGNGFTITGLEGNQGLFSVIGAEGVLKNVNVVDASITSGSTVGVISERSGGTIIGVYASGDVTVDNPTANGSIIGSFGGLVGRNYGTIAASVADVDVTVKSIPTGKSARVGGFVGMNYHHIHGSYAYGNVIDGRSGSALGARGFRAYGFAINHTGAGGEIHWSFSYGNKVAGETKPPLATFAHGGLVTNSCALKNRRTDFTFANCPTPTLTPTN